MKLFINFSFVLLFIATSFANTITNNIIKLPKHFKTEKTFSGDLNDNESFHLIFSKNKQNKMYTIHPFLFNGKEITEINPFENNKEFSTISFHKKNNILTLLLSYKEKKKHLLKRVSINLLTKKVTENTPIDHEDFSTVITNKSNSILLYKTDDKISIKKFDGNDKQKSFSFELKKDSSYKDFFKDQNISTIKTDEFVANGSTQQVKLYYKDNILYFTKEGDKPLNVNVAGFSLNNKKKSVTQFLKFDLNTNTEPEYFSFKNYSDKKFNKATSYFSDRKLFQIAMTKKKGYIKIYDINTKKAIKEISIDNNLNAFIKGNEDFDGIEIFLKKASRVKHNATITVNKTKNNNLKIRVDYVDKTYSYNYNWWWHHHQFMMQQQMIMNQVNFSRPRGFGPAQPNDFHFENYLIKKSKRYFELVLNQNYDLLDSNEDTIYKEVDKQKYIDQLEKITDLKKESSCFLKDSFRYIGYSRNLNAFTITTNKLK